MPLCCINTISHITIATKISHLVIIILSNTTKPNKQKPKQLTKKRDCKKKKLAFLTKKVATCKEENELFVFQAHIKHKWKRVFIHYV